MASSWFATGCQEDAEQAGIAIEREVGLGDGPITRIAGFDHGALSAALQGDWIVIQRDKRVFEFTILDDEVRVLDHRFAQPRTIRGRLVLRSATSFGVASVEGPRYFFGFVVVDGTTYMGQGGAVALRGDEAAFEASLGAWETLVRTESDCTLVSTFGGGKSERKVTCEFVEDKGEEDEVAVRKAFRYQAPDPFRPDRLKTFELTVRGDYLMDRDLASSIASRRGDVPSANSLEPGEKASGESR
ncbi:MAG: hypothetical protein ACPGU1_05685 [Myxococcota bacterium]